MLHGPAGFALQRSWTRLAHPRLVDACIRLGWRGLADSASHRHGVISNNAMQLGGRARLAARAALAGPPPVPPAPLAAHFCSSSSGLRQRLQQHVGASHVGLTGNGTGSTKAEQWGTARPQSLRGVAGPAHLPWGPRLPSRRMHAFSPAWHEQPGEGRQEQQHEQQQQQQQGRRGISTKPRWQFWARSGGGRGDSGKEARAGSASAAAAGLVPPAPLPADTPSAAQERELRAVNVAVLVNGVIFLAKMATWLVTGSGWVHPGLVKRRQDSRPFQTAPRVCAVLAPRRCARWREGLPVCLPALAPRGVRSLLAWHHAQPLLSLWFHLAVRCLCAMLARASYLQMRTAAPSSCCAHKLPLSCAPLRSALLAEGLHSIADVANQLLLKHGVIRSRRKPTRDHQYGFHKEKYVYALISGTAPPRPRPGRRLELPAGRTGGLCPRGVARWAPAASEPWQQSRRAAARCLPLKHPPPTAHPQP